MKRISILLASLVAASIVGPAAPAAADTTEISIAQTAWYWQEAQSSEQTLPDGSKVQIDTPSPFCPQAPGGLGGAEQTCAQGRLPIEVRRGDYKNQNKISAVGFDMSLIPVGSEVAKFTATFREAETGCYDNEDQDKDPNYCEETSPINVGKHKLKACLVNAFFGDGEARPYAQAPKFTCTDSDPLATRKEVKPKKGDPYFVWTFDLTAYAKTWVEKFSTNTAIMITGVPLKKEGDDESWRVVLTGPNFQDGFTSEISFTPAELPPIAPIDLGTGTGTGLGASGTDFGTGTGTTDFGTDTGTDLGTDTGAEATDPAATGEAAEETGEELPQLATEAGAEATPESVPGYVWLAILAGLIGFSLVRSVVVESASGIRPNGVLAQIQRMNAERRGLPAAGDASSGGGAFSSLASGLSTIGSKVGSLFGKLPFKR